MEKMCLLSKDPVVFFTESILSLWMSLPTMCRSTSSLTHPPGQPEPRWSSGEEPHAEPAP